MKINIFKLLFGLLSKPEKTVADVISKDNPLVELAVDEVGDVIRKELKKKKHVN